MTIRKWLELELVFDWPATEEEAADTCEKHLSSTGIYVHEVQAFAPGVETRADVASKRVYTWHFRVDASFEPLEPEQLRVATLGPTGLVDIHGNPLTGGVK